MYSQVGQDDWVLSLFPKTHKGFFLDIGCFYPIEINNTLLLEENGWSGLAFDIGDFENKWAIRKTPYIKADVTICNFNEYNIPKLVDYLSLDVDTLGRNYLVMKRLINFRFEFKVITIEHNIYGGQEFDEEERIPQRVLLSTENYTLLKADVCNKGINPFEDWWINKKYIQYV